MERTPICCISYTNYTLYMQVLATWTVTYPGHKTASFCYRPLGSLAFGAAPGPSATLRFSCGLQATASSSGKTVKQSGSYDLARRNPT